MLTAWEEHPPVPRAPCLGTAALTQPREQALGTSQKRALPMEGRPEGKLWGRHGVKWRLPAASCPGRAAG